MTGNHDHGARPNILILESSHNLIDRDPISLAEKQYCYLNNKVVSPCYHREGSQDIPNPLPRYSQFHCHWVR